MLLLPVRNAGTPLELPFTVVDGSVDWEVTAPRNRLSTLADQLRQFGIQFHVTAVQTEQLLTPKQETLVRTAVEEGYYDTPRKSTLTELANTHGIAKSTCSETLHRAEEKIVKEFVDELGDVQQQDVSATPGRDCDDVRYDTGSHTESRETILNMPGPISR